MWLVVSRRETLLACAMHSNEGAAPGCSIPKPLTCALTLQDGIELDPAASLLSHGNSLLPVTPILSKSFWVGGQVSWHA